MHVKFCQKDAYWAGWGAAAAGGGATTGFSAPGPWTESKQKYFSIPCNSVNPIGIYIKLLILILL